MCTPKFFDGRLLFRFAAAIFDRRDATEDGSIFN